MNQQQFGLAKLFWVVTLFCAFLALTMSDNELFQLIAGTVIATNILGAIAALFITHSLGFPRDGSYRNENSSIHHIDDSE